MLRAHFCFTSNKLHIITSIPKTFIINQNTGDSTFVGFLQFFFFSTILLFCANFLNCIFLLLHLQFRGKHDWRVFAFVSPRESIEVFTSLLSLSVHSQVHTFIRICYALAISRRLDLILRIVVFRSA